MLFKKRKYLKNRYPQYKIGRETYGNPKVHFKWQDATLEVGAFTSFAHGVQIFLGGEHRMDWVTTFPFSALWKEGKSIPDHPRTKGNVLIGNDVWVAREAMIMSGVTIGDGAVIGARAVITKDVPPYTIVAGNPATIIKKRFDDKTIQRLLNIKWWDWNDTDIAKSLPLLLNENIDNFIEYAESKKEPA